MEQFVKVCVCSGIFFFNFGPTLARIFHATKARRGGDLLSFNVFQVDVRDTAEIKTNTCI